MNTQKSDPILNALSQIERTQRHYKFAFLGALLVEVALLTGLMLMVNLKDRTHALLLVGFVGSYSVIALAIVALGAHVSKVGLRIIRAIEASGIAR
jgi:hypothetical protein